MSPCRPVPANNRSRLLMAALLAIAVHGGLISWRLEPRPVSSPRISLPRSVTVLLGRQSPETIPAAPQEKPQEAMAAPPAATKPAAAKSQQVLEQQPAAAAKNDAAVGPAEVPEKKLPMSSAPAAAISRPEISHQATRPQNTAEVAPAAARVKAAENSGGMMKAAAVAEDHAAQQPGTIQLAYPRYQVNEPPAYPYLARKRGREGTVVLQVLVNREGRVEDLAIDTTSGFALLDRAAEKAVRKWLFEPGREDDRKIRMWVRVPVTFKLQ